MAVRTAQATNRHLMKRLRTVNASECLPWHANGGSVAEAYLIRYSSCCEKSEGRAVANKRQSKAKDQPNAQLGFEAELL